MPTESFLKDKDWGKNESITACKQILDRIYYLTAEQRGDCGKFGLPLLMKDIADVLQAEVKAHSRPELKKQSSSRARATTLMLLMVIDSKERDSKEG